MSPAAIISTRLFCRTSFAGRAINHFPESVARTPSPVIIPGSFSFQKKP